MITLFEKETEVGKCAYEPEDASGFKYAEPDYSIVCAHTLATLNGNKGVLKIEHQCYLRHGGELPDQPWIKPEIVLEPIAGSKQDLLDFAEESHLKFVQHVLERFPEQYLA